jgi:hypothetical protein
VSPTRHTGRRCALAGALALAALLVGGCAARSAPRVVFLGDGVFGSPTTQEAEAYCRNFGAPIRFIDADTGRAPAGPLRYRCD